MVEHVYEGRHTRVRKTPKGAAGNLAHSPAAVQRHARDSAAHHARMVRRSNRGPKKIPRQHGLGLPRSQLHRNDTERVCTAPPASMLCSCDNIRTMTGASSTEGGEGRVRHADELL